LNRGISKKFVSSFEIANTKNATTLIFQRYLSIVNEKHVEHSPDLKSNKQFLELAAKKLKVNQTNDWYRVSPQVTFIVLSILKIKDLRDIGGSPHVDLPNLLSSVYPDNDWLPWRFSTCPESYWDNKKNQRKFMDWAANELKIKNKEDWYKVTTKVRKIFNLKIIL
jgi:hypothetical protein